MNATEREKKCFVAVIITCIVQRLVFSSPFIRNRIFLCKQLVVYVIAAPEEPVAAENVRHERLAPNA